MTKTSGGQQHSIRAVWDLEIGNWILPADSFRSPYFKHQFVAFKRHAGEDAVAGGEDVAGGLHALAESIAGGLDALVVSAGLKQSAVHVAAETTSGRIWLSEVGSSTHYHATYVNPRWNRRMKRVGRIGLHIFYRTFNGGWS